MSTTPPEQPAGSTRPPMGMPSIPAGARMPIPGNAEFALWLVIEIVFVIIWISAKSVDTRTWTILTAVLTSFYFLSRGIAKASRVLEQ
jgi:nicotinamide riboside transporter PnuC